jgi:tRNA pseudouridine38-40 synthase
MLKLKVAYEGTRYFGWQKNPLFPTIEGELAKAFFHIFHQDVPLEASSRTDRGVHAEGQVVSANIFPETPTQKLLRSLNALLPCDIVVLSLEDAPPDFHPTLQASSKTYRYEICYGPTQLPRHRLFSWHFPYMLSLEAMGKAAGYFLGTHDFASFCNQKENEEYENHLRTVDKLEITPCGEHRLQIEISGSKFLYKMVRNIMGTLAYAGIGKIDPEAVPSILAMKKREAAGVTAPAHGLTLQSVDFSTH